MNLSCTSHQAHLHLAADRKKTWFLPLPDPRRDTQGNSQAGKNSTNGVPNKYNKDTSIVILNAVKDLLPFPKRTSLALSPPIVILNVVKDLLPFPNALPLAIPPPLSS